VAAMNEFEMLLSVFTLLFGSGTLLLWWQAHERKMEFDDLIGKGDSYRTKSDYEKAVENYKEAADVYKKTSRKRAKAFKELGCVYLLLEKYPETIECSQDALIICNLKRNRKKSKEDIALLNHNIALAYYRLERPEALEYILAAYKAFPGPDVTKLMYRDYVKLIYEKTDHEEPFDDWFASELKK
jgi:tetratricopeptide (TPR) repeat protein